VAFVKGQSGNPGGRPKEDGEVKRLAREFGAEAVQRLADIMRGDNPKVAVTAAVALLDRGYGKPTQVIAGDDELPPVQLGVIELVRPS
jgi:hypothetical protein